MTETNPSECRERPMKYINVDDTNKIKNFYQFFGCLLVVMVTSVCNFYSKGNLEYILNYFNSGLQLP